MEAKKLFIFLQRRLNKIFGAFLAGEFLVEINLFAVLSSK